MVLQRVHQLVRHDHAHLGGIDVVGDEQGAGIGVEVARDLLGEQIDHQRPQIERVGDQAEQAIRRLGAGELRGGQVVIELVDHVVAHLLAGATLDPRVAFEAQAGRPLDRRHHLPHHLLQLALTARGFGALAAGTGRARETEDAERRTRDAQPAHSIPLPTAAPTARATS